MGQFMFRERHKIAEPQRAAAGHFARSLLLGAMLCAAASCGGGAAPTDTNKPPVTTNPSAATPASVTIVSGDGQSALPGTTLPAPLSVVVRDAANATMAGVSVRFTVDSGGGTISVSTASTGADGMATGGTWTIGASAGVNVVSATVANIAPVRFHALGVAARSRAILTNAPVAAGGGTLRYNVPGDALSGLSIVVPAGAFSNATSWNVVADSITLPTLPAGFTQVGPTLVIGNGQDFAASNMTLTMPMRLAATETVAPFYFDPATNTLEGIPIVAATDSSVTLATRHFNAREVAIPGSGPSLGVARALSSVEFGDVRIVWVRTNTASLVGSWSSTFRPGVDDWEFANYGDFIEPGGDCEGMSISAMFYHYFFHPTAAGKGLYHQFDTTVVNQWDNVQGIRFAGSVQGDYELLWERGARQLDSLIEQGIAAGIQTKFLTSTWILLTLKLTQQPVLLTLKGTAGAHAVIAYAATFDGTKTVVSFADPNAPGATRTMTFVNGIVTPVPLQENVSSPATAFGKAWAIGVTAEVPLVQINSRWLEFAARRAGSDRYPDKYQLEDSLDVDRSWTRVEPADTIWTAQSVKARFMCSACTVKASAPSDLQFAYYWAPDGSAQLSTANVPDGFTSFLMVLKALSPYPATSPGGLGFVDAQKITIGYHALSITASTGINNIVPAKLTAHPGVLGRAQSIYVWQFNDGTTPGTVTVTGDSTVTHTFPVGGPYTVTVTMRDPVRAPAAAGFGTAKLSVTSVLAQLAWRFTSAALVSSQLPPGGIGSERTDTLVDNLFNGWKQSMITTPQNSLLFLYHIQEPRCRGIYLEQFPPGQYAPVLDSTFAGAVKAFLGSDCPPDPSFTWSLTMGTLGSGTLVASAVNIPQEDEITLPGGSINSTMSGLTLTGTLVWRVRYSTGVALNTFSFTATRVLPVP